MSAPIRVFEVKDAVREAVPLLIGVFGSSGSGKTYSALRLATGIQRVTGGDIYGIDTEARRMLHYSDQFKFKHIQFDPPFGSLDYLAALRQCVAAGAKVIIVDSFSHEHASEGGYLMTQATELDRMAGDDYAKRERVKMAAWIKPAQLRTQMINGILQMNVNLICCFRAKEKTRPIKTPGGKTEIKEMGFMAISGDELLYEMTVNCLLLPAANGVPTWKSEEPGERALMKLPQQFREIFAPQTPLSEDIGEQLARWAAGGVQPPKPEPATAGTGSQPFTVDDHPLPTESQLEAEARAAARLGKEALQAYWKTLTQPQRRMIKPLMDGELKATAIEADAMRETVPAKDEVV